MKIHLFVGALDNETEKILFDTLGKHDLEIVAPAASLESLKIWQLDESKYLSIRLLFLVDSVVLFKGYREEWLDQKQLQKLLEVIEPGIRTSINVQVTEEDLKAVRRLEKVTFLYEQQVPKGNLCQYMAPPKKQQGIPAKAMRPRSNRRRR